LLSEDAGRDVSIEHADDVAVHWSAGALLEQTISATAQNPASDFAVDLWKTFANWIEAIEAGDIDLNKTYFRLYVTPKRSGEIVKALSFADTDAAADKVVALVEAELSALSKKPAAYKFLKKFLDFDVKKRRKLIRRFSFESVHEDPLDAIRKLLRATLDERIVETACAFAVGRAKETADALLRAGKPAIISAYAFQKDFKAFVHKHDLSRFLDSLAPIPGDAEIEATLAKSPTFVRQLDLVDIPEDLKVQAVSDYLQASVNKTRWADEGKVLRESFREFDRNLVRQHGYIKLELGHLASDPKGLGRTLYGRCASSAVTLEGREVPDHFVPGCFNELSDRKLLGWHPDYMNLLSDE
jgi:hypothetical protein